MRPATWFVLAALLAPCICDKAIGQNQFPPNVSIATPAGTLPLKGQRLTAVPPGGDPSVGLVYSGIALWPAPVNPNAPKVGFNQPMGASGYGVVFGQGLYLANFGNFGQLGLDPAGWYLICTTAQGQVAFGAWQGNGQLSGVVGPLPGVNGMSNGMQVTITPLP